MLRQYGLLLLSSISWSVLGLPLRAAEKPVALYKGLGAWHHPIHTKSEEAQKYFDQGLTLAYGFNRYEALRSFQKASELDPAAPMALWGVALAQGPYINMDGDPSFNNKNACAALDKAQKLHTDAREAAYIKAALSWCPEYKPDSYVEAARQLATAYPDDPDAVTIYGDSLLVRKRWHWYGANGSPAEGVAEAEQVLQQVIRRWPQHPAANHLYIHAVESSPTPERGVASAQRLMGIVPGAGHMVHMPGHIWLVLGDWETAASVNERAVTVDREYFRDTQVNGGTYEPYYVHNLHFIAYARSMQGRKAQALQAADEIAKEASGMADAMPEMADMFSPVPILIYARMNAWTEILRLPQPPQSLKGSQVVWRYARTLAFKATRNQKAAEREREAFEKLRSSVPPDVPLGQSTAQDVLKVASYVIAARLASNPAEACEHWKGAVESQDHLAYDEPPDWYYPVRESYGACLLKSGKASEAASVFREGIRRSPRNGRMLFGLWQSVNAEGKSDEAALVKREFEQAWAGADMELRMDDL